MSIEPRTATSTPIIKMPKGLYVIGPMYNSEMIGWNGPHYTWREYPDGRWSDCKINGRLVGPVAFKLHRNAIKKPRHF